MLLYRETVSKNKTEKTRGGKIKEIAETASLAAMLPRRRGN